MTTIRWTDVAGYSLEDARERSREHRRRLEREGVRARVIERDDALIVQRGEIAHDSTGGAR